MGQLLILPFLYGKMKVKLINHTPKPIQTVYIAARTCYSAEGPQTLWDSTEIDKEKDISYEKMYSLLDKVFVSGHLSVLEHISFTFAIEGISRACSHQLVRHRIASFSQQSQRYVEIDEDDFIIPATISENIEANEIFKDFLVDVSKIYKQLIEIGIPREDARFVLPNAAATNIVMTMNFRELYNVSQIRLCTRAQWEIRSLFWLIKSEIKKILELTGLAEYLQPTCKILGYCPENKSCGLMPSQNEVT